ncbi:MAG: GGDEF domain-containing protein [Candidatus Moranbacteria bacterium]|nr:GGDEF domain-containing protein [Candidatus Moranbacteria bacterium]
MSISKTEDRMYTWWLKLGEKCRMIVGILICILISSTPGIVCYIFMDDLVKEPVLFITMAVLLGFCGTISFSILWTRAAKDRRALNEANMVLEKLCCLDPLTGLNNRNFMDTAALKAVKQAGRENAHIFSVMMDVNKLKEVNDTYGHAAGDEVIKHAAFFIRRIFRDHDHIMRTGGDEFEAIGITNSPEEFMTSLREKITTFPVTVGQTTLQMSVSYGCAFEKVSKTIANHGSDELQTYATKLHMSVSSSADAHMYVMKKKR